MSSELIPVTQMEIKHLSHFFEDLPLNSVQKSLTRTIFNKTDNFYVKNYIKKKENRVGGTKKTRRKRKKEEKEVEGERKGG